MPETEPVHGYDHTLCVDEIVCRMIDFDQDANDMPFEEVLDCWVEQAEQAYERAQRKELPVDLLKELSAEHERRKAVRGEAMKMYAELNNAADEIAQGHDHPFLVLCQRKYARGLVEFAIPSVFMWAKAPPLGKYIPEWELSDPGPFDQDSSDTPTLQPTPVISWVGVTLSFMANNKIKFVSRDGSSKIHDLEGAGLINKRTKGLNTAGAALLTLSSRKCIPKKSRPDGPGISKKILCELRTTLKEMINIEADPFYPYNEADGWKPHFRVFDRRYASDERAEEKAQHTSYIDGLHSATAPEEYTFTSEDTKENAAANLFFEENDR